MVLQEVRLITGRASDAPVVDPDLETVVLADLADLVHHAKVAVPVVVREHMNDDVHILTRHLCHIIRDVAQDAVAVVAVKGFDITINGKATGSMLVQHAAGYIAEDEKGRNMRIFGKR